jgi:hypothetical protein
MSVADSLALHALVEDPARWEAMIQAEIERARTDPSARAVLEAIYCDEDREAAFERFRTGLEAARTLALLERLGVPKEARIVEIGGGGGWLGWALHRAGYRRLEMLEPNGEWVSGTGYLRTRPDAAEIHIWNDLDAFYADPGRYDLVLSHNCVHHFRSIAFVAACLRQKLVPRGRWLMVREQYADTAEELYRLLSEHPYCQRYGVFEFAYPAYHFVESVEHAGFAVEGVVPARYANGVLASDVREPGSRLNQLGSRAFEALLGARPGATVALYGAELFAARYLGWKRKHFIRPQAVLFRRRELP